MQMPIQLNEGFPRHVVRMRRSLFQRQNRRETHVGTLHDFAPFIAGLAFDNMCQLGFHVRPFGRVHLRGKPGVIRQADFLQQNRIELWFYRPYADVSSIRTFISVIKGRGTVEKVGSR